MTSPAYGSPAVPRKQRHRIPVDLLRVGWLLVVLAMPAGIATAVITNGVLSSGMIPNKDESFWIGYGAWFVSATVVLALGGLAGLLAVVFQRRPGGLLVLVVSALGWVFVGLLTVIGAI